MIKISSKDRGLWERCMAAPRDACSAENRAAYKALFEGLALERQIQKCLAKKQGVKLIEIDHFTPVEKQGVNFELISRNRWKAVKKSLENQGLIIADEYIFSDDHIVFTVAMRLQ